MKAIKPCLFLLIAVCMVQMRIESASAQDKFKYRKENEVEYSNRVHKIQETESIVYYGLDFKLGVLTDPSKIHEAELIVNKYIPGWMNLTNERFNDDYLRKKFKNKIFTSNLGAVQNEFRSIIPSEFVVFERKDLTIEEIKERVKEYDLNEENGIGFVYIHEDFNKPGVYGSGVFVLFDINNREVYYALRLVGRPGSKYGFMRWWGESLHGTYNKFIGRFVKLLEESR